jgi:hypothetical protein
VSSVPNINGRLVDCVFPFRAAMLKYKEHREVYIHVSIRATTTGIFELFMRYTGRG